MFKESFFNFFLSVDFLFFLTIAFLFFLIFRELVTWYWKINRIVHLLEEIEINTSFLRIKNESKLNTSNNQMPDLNKYQSEKNKKLSNLENYLIYLTIFAGFFLVILIIYIFTK